MTISGLDRPLTRLGLIALLFGATLDPSISVAAPPDALQGESALRPPRVESTVRIATFNTSLYRQSSGELRRELEAGSEQARAVASILRCIDADVMLLNEFDYDGGKAAEIFLEKYLNLGLPEGERWQHHFTAAVNTGVDSGLDLDGDGKTQTPNDAWGFGTHPGQYGMLVISRFAIDASAVRTFQKFRWAQLPSGLRPMNLDGTSYYPDAIWQQLRLSSKSHWDVPIQAGLAGSVHLLVSHPTPPVFDGPEDRNGNRNHDEIRFWLDYVSGDASYIVDDAGRAGGLPQGEPFVIAGDLNADPYDGDGRHEIIQRLLASPMTMAEPTPASEGAIEAAREQGRANETHRGEPEHDTGDFSDRAPGNLRADYVLPGGRLKVLGSGVLWPAAADMPAEWSDASDHHAVWVDVARP